MSDWRDEALCAQTDPELWFPDHGGSNTAAKAICARCPVRVACLEWTLANETPGTTFGVAGGLTAEQRLVLQRRAA